MKPLSETLRETRARLNWPLSRMAPALGISKRSLCYYESGEIVPPPESEVVTRESLLAKLATLERAAKVK